MRVAIVAEHASKRFGGEAILPYHYFRVLRERGVEAWLVVHSRTRPEMIELFPEELERLIFVEDLTLHKVIYQVSRIFPRRISEATFGLANQLLTQLCQRRIVKRLVRDHDVDVVHQPIPVSPRFPSLMSGLGAPVVIGPLNGGMDYPPAFKHAESAFSRAAIALGRSFSNIVNAVLPGKRNAAVVLVANERTRQALPSGLRGQVIELPENGVDLAQWSTKPATRDANEPQRFLFIGRLVDWKALHIAIRALAITPGAQLDVIGGGPMEAAWKALTVQLGVQDRVRFLGFQPQDVCAKRLGAARALLLPSIYECGGAVVLEAMAMSKPVIATAWGGPADYVTPDCGILVEPGSEDSLVAGFAQAMGLLMDNTDLCNRLGAEGRRRLVQVFDWEKKIDRMLDIYASTQSRVMEKKTQNLSA
ncbi:Glycosyltransferase involved in cell wall bisynthesis [Granulicella rosea]|uniref:Glycosyltransferase involved in cell wall bisynthesis n=1 Tax=Granulicella rosea TaxID=474952 RepID=A0A239EVR3_9BACT|nr:glycosyltransferase family 4 protein [Granulicella rosea]SNS47992.1 Glycosyltransferase involved in cell wall bisynthesis [Granulicella rosea]